MSKKFFRFSGEVISGVYLIKNLANCSVYIGSSVDIYGRWRQHIWDLYNDRHHNLHLQNAWNKYGQDNFDFLIIENVVGDRDYIFEREQYWIDCYVANGICVYNHNKINSKTPTHYTTIEDLQNCKRGFSLEQFVDVCDYLVNTDIPIVNIAEMFNVSACTIYGIYEKTSYVELTKDMNFIKRKKPSIKLSKDDVENIIERMLNSEFDKDIANDYGISVNTIKDIRAKRIWKDLTKNIIFPNATRYRPPTTSVIQYDLDMNFIAEYLSARDAERITGIGHKMISKVCNYKRPYTHGFVFRFKDELAI